MGGMELMAMEIKGVAEALKALDAASPAALERIANAVEPSKSGDERL
jgi:hypothetical protein